jgi:hypothetical protein
MFQIETNVPVPAVANRGATASVYPLADMYVGDSFLVPLEPITLADRRRVSAAVTGFAKRHKAKGLKFSVRSVEGGLRVWRVA